MGQTVLNWIGYSLVRDSLVAEGIFGKIFNVKDIFEKLF